MNGPGMAWLAAMTLGAAATLQPPSPVAPAGIGQEQTLQQQVQAMTRQLVGDVLDVQIRQLKENRLESHPIYAEIVQMRKHLDLLVETEMTRVAELLAKASSEPDDARQEALREARQQSRQIVVTLLAERQNLLRRLRIAEMAAQVRQLIGMQSRILTTTRRLPEQPPSRREQLVLTSIEDQRDVAALYSRFKQTLTEVAGWSGPVGPEAAEGLRLLEAYHVDQELTQAEAGLREARFNDSADRQGAAIEGLKRLLIQIHKIQGLAQPDRNAAQEAVQRMIDQQQEIRQATENTDFSQPEADKLINRQAELHKKVAELQQKSDLPAVARSELKKAEESAKAAAAKMFDQKRDEALAQQDNTINNLKKAAEQSRTAPQEKPAPAANREQLAVQAADLENARKELAQAAQEQQRATSAAADKPAQAKEHEKQVAQRLSDVPKGRQLPEKVAERVREAHQAAQQAEKKMDQPAPTRKQAAQQAEQAIQHAISETETALGDAKRSLLAARRQDLEQAAQALDKAAADERHVARQSQQAAQARGLEKPQAERLAEKHADAQKTAADVGRKLAQSSPQATQAIQEAEKPMAEAQSHLKSAQQQPGEASKPSAAAIAKHAQQAAEHLEKAVARVREEQQRAAAEQNQQAANTAAKEQKPPDGPATTASGGGIEGQPPDKNNPASSIKAEQQAGSVAAGRRGESGSSENPVAAAVQDNPWFAKLPPEVRGAIRANAQRTPPRGYEERLQRYFKDIE